MSTGRFGVIGLLSVMSLMRIAHAAHRGSTSSIIFPEANRSQRRMKSDDKNSGGVADNLAETKACLPFSELPESTINHYNTYDECKVQNGCSSGCCRIYDWMVCDDENRLPNMRCVCNANTATQEPSSAPSFTVGPTLSPTVTFQPSSAPSPSPSATPSTSSPSTNPTFPPPTSSPTTFVPTITSTFSPSPPPATPSPSSLPVDPTAPPTGGPTVTPFTTVDTTDEAGNPVRTTACLHPPENPQFVRDASYTYRYQVYAPDTVDPTDVVDLYLSRQVHDAVVNQFFKCTFEEDDIWVYQSDPHVVSTNSTCVGSPVSGEQCFVVTASDTVWVYEAPGRRKLQSSGVVNYILGLTAFINEAMAAGYFNDPSDISKVLFIDDGSTPISTSQPLPTDSPTGSPVTGAPVSQVNSGNVPDEGPSTSVVSILSVAGALVVIVLFVALARRRRHREVDYLDKETLDRVPNVATLEEHVELDSMGGSLEFGGDGFEVVDDPYTSASPPRRSERGPLFSQDELDHVVGNRRGFTMQHHESPAKQGRQYRASDTVNL